MRPGAKSTCRTTGASKDAPRRTIPTGSGGGFFPAGTGWYRKTFSAPAEWKGKRVSVEFDGVYRDATVYLNGHKLGNSPTATPVSRFDLTPDLDYAEPNVLAVRVDNSAQPNSRWYSGSGIYRHVRVVVTDPRSCRVIGECSSPRAKHRMRRRRCRSARAWRMNL